MAIAVIRSGLLAWYDEHARDLPWRRTSDPYAIWVSEIMCQQTRVDTAIPYYERFMQTFPTSNALAEATEDEVLALWSGLGYYRRARLLHQGVREVVQRYDGEVPEGREERLALPGVGKYTAGAIGSIAFDKNEPVVDGNVVRVLSRLMRIKDRIGTTASDKQLWSYASSLVDGPRPGALNQAIMELGATVCTKSNPDCTQCPIASHCFALAHDEVSALPLPRVRKAPKIVNAVAVVAHAPDNGDVRCWMVRGKGSLFGGLWSLPMVEGKNSIDNAKLALSESGANGKLTAKSHGCVEHALTHRRYKVCVYSASQTKGESQGDRRFMPIGELGSVGVSKLTKSILQKALGQAANLEL